MPYCKALKVFTRFSINYRKPVWMSIIYLLSTSVLSLFPSVAYFEFQPPFHNTNAIYNSLIDGCMIRYQHQLYSHDGGQFSHLVCQQS